MLDANLTQQLTQYLAMLREPIELVATLGDDGKSAELRALLEQIAGMSDKVSASFGGDDARRPSFVIRRAGNPAVATSFAGRRHTWAQFGERVARFAAVLRGAD